MKDVKEFLLEIFDGQVELCCCQLFALKFLFLKVGFLFKIS